jgi:hypothetical protein
MFTADGIRRSSPRARKIIQAYFSYAFSTLGEVISPTSLLLLKTV